MYVDSIHICHQVVENVLKTEGMLRLYGGKPPITGCGQNKKIILYRFLLCLSSAHGWGPTLTGLNGKNKHSLTSAAEFSLGEFNKTEWIYISQISLSTLVFWGSTVNIA